MKVCVHATEIIIIHSRRSYGRMKHGQVWILWWCTIKLLWGKKYARLHEWLFVATSYKAIEVDSLGVICMWRMAARMSTWMSVWDKVFGSGTHYLIAFVILRGSNRNFVWTVLIGRGWPIFPYKVMSVLHEGKVLYEGNFPGDGSGHYPTERTC